jgi:hypothetical protein
MFSSMFRDFVTLPSWMATTVSIVALICGTWLAAAFILGFGVADTWIIYPPHITLMHWCLPVALIGSALWHLGFLLSRCRQVSLRVAFGVIAVLAVMFATIAPLYRQFHERQVHDANMKRWAEEHDRAADAGGT